MEHPTRKRKRDESEEERKEEKKGKEEKEEEEEKNVTMSSSGQLFSKTTQAVIYNYKTPPVQVFWAFFSLSPSPIRPSLSSFLFSNHETHFFFLQRMLDFDYLCQRKTPSVAALITPGTTQVCVS